MGNGRARDLITLGDGSNAQSQARDIPSDLVLDRVLVLGDATAGQKRGIALNSASTTIKNSYIGEIKAAGQESQAIAGWNGPGPYTIENNVLQAAGVNIMFGGADPAVPDLVPSDIVIRHNVMTKNLEWRGTPWTVKNLLELKNARRVRIEGNRLENCWSAAQVGYAVVFTVRNSGGHAPWATIEHVVFRDNVVRHAAGGVNILGSDSTSREPDGVGHRDRQQPLRGHRSSPVGRQWLFLLIGNAPSGVIIDHNTILQTGNIMTVYGGKRGAWMTIPGFRFTNNVARHNAYGIFGDGVGFGTKAIEAYFTDAVITNNVLAGGPANQVPGGQLLSVAGDTDGRLHATANGATIASALEAPSSELRPIGSDVGANFDELTRAQVAPDLSTDHPGGAL